MDSVDKISVLLVDDRPEKLLALEAVLSDLPLELVRASSGREALDAILSREFAVILLDINMPDMDGFETAQLMRQREGSGHTPIIFVSGYSDDVFVSRGYSLGAVDYILQPVVPEILRSKVSVFVDLYRKTRAISEQAAWLEQRASQLQKLASASVAINGAQSMSRTLQLTTDWARDVIASHQAITLFFLDEDGAAPARTRAFCSFSDKYAGWRGRPMNLDSVVGSLVAGAAGPSRVGASELPGHPGFSSIRRLENSEIPPVIGLLAAPLIGRQGRTRGLVYVSDKVTGEFTADDEAVLVQFAQTASVAVENILTADARDANRAKDQFIAVLSHELRIPLTPVLATLAGLQSDERLPGELRDDVQLIRRNVELEARLIDDLLDLTRISKGKVELQVEVVDGNELVREAANICRNDIKEKGIELVLDLSAGQRWVKGDATRLQQVFWNVIKNAVKFSGSQGRIVLESGNPREGEFCVRVRDSGIGIEPEALPRIFRAFEQGRCGVTRQFGGLGLGLTISKALVEQHGGSLEASSPGKDKGAVFTVRIPTTHEEPLSGTHPAPHMAPSAPPRVVRILLVEDHRDTARVMAKLLRGDGYSVDCAATFGEALDAIKSGTHEILISDIGLPDGSGLDLIRQARALQPITGIALSGFGMEQDIRRSLDAGFALHLTKPINVQLLIKSIDGLTRVAEGPLAETSPDEAPAGAPLPPGLRAASSAAPL